MTTTPKEGPPTLRATLHRALVSLGEGLKFASHKPDCLKLADSSRACSCDMEYAKDKIVQVCDEVSEASEALERDEKRRAEEIIKAKADAWDEGYLSLGDDLGWERLVWPLSWHNIKNKTKNPHALTPAPQEKNMA